MQEKVAADSCVELSCTVENSGTCDGEEVVQVYVTDEMSSMMRPAQELAGFYRVKLKAGERKSIHFSMRADQFAFLDQKMHCYLSLLWLKEHAQEYGVNQNQIFVGGESAGGGLAAALCLCARI